MLLGVRLTILKRATREPTQSNGRGPLEKEEKFGHVWFSLLSARAAFLD